MTLHRILVATDFTQASVSAVKEAIEIAKECRAELLIAHAYIPPNVTQADSVAPGVYEEWDENLCVGVAKRLQPLVQSALRQSVSARSLILPGAPHRAIVDAAKENRVDLVVVGTHARKGLARFFLGSVAARVISRAPCPVLVVRAALPDHPRGEPKEVLYEFRTPYSPRPRGIANPPEGVRPRDVPIRRDEL